MQCNKHLIIGIFMLVFQYFFIPAAALFSVIAGLTLSCYSFKCTVFLFTGNLSVHNYNMPQQLIVSKIELLIGVLFSAVSGGLFALYEMYRTKQLQRREPRMMMPYDPQDMSERGDTIDHEDAINMTSNVFEELVLTSDSDNDFE